MNTPKLVQRVKATLNEHIVGDAQPAPLTPARATDYLSSVTASLARLRRLVDYACEAVRVGDVGAFLRWCMAFVACSQAVCEKYNVDLAGAIDIKVAYNRTRSYRHGGKRA